MYDRCSSATDIDSVRRHVCPQAKSYDAIPPKSATLDYHTKHTLTKQVASGAIQQLTKWKYSAHQNGGGSNKITHCKLSGRHFHEMPRAASS